MAEWTTEQEEELNALKQARDALTKGLEKRHPLAATAVNKLTEVVDLATGKEYAARQLPPGVGSMVGSEVGARELSAAGMRLGGKMPGGPLVKGAAMLAGGAGGYLVGRLGGAYVGGAGGEAPVALYDYVTKETPDTLDQFFERLHRTGTEQAIGEAVSIPLSGITGGARWMRTTKPEVSLETQALAGWMHDNFKRTYSLLTDQERQKMGLDPEMTAKVIEAGGLTAAEKVSSRLYDLIQGVAAGSLVGGGRITQFHETRDKLLQATVARLGEEVGKKIDPSDLSDLIHKGVNKQFEDDGAFVTGLNTRLVTQSKGATITLPKSWTRTSSAFGPMVNAFEAGDILSVNQYRQARDQLQKIARDFRRSPPIRNEANSLTKKLDMAASRSLPRDAVDTLKTIRHREQSIDDTYLNDKFMAGILRVSNNTRTFVEGVVKRSDYRQLEKLLDHIPDTDVQDNLRRAFLEHVLGGATVGKNVPSDTLRMNLETTVGRKPIQRILGKPMDKNLDRYVQALEHIDDLKGRGEAGRVMTALTQGTYLMGGVTGALAGRLKARDLGAATAVLFMPGQAAKLLTNPATSEKFIKFAQAIGNPKVPEHVIVRKFKDIAGFVMDHKVVERMAGRWLAGNVDSDAGFSQYLRDAGLVSEAETQPDQGGAPPPSPRMPQVSTTVPMSQEAE